MTKLNQNTGSETKSDFFPWYILKPDIIFHWSPNTKNISMTFITSVFQFHNKCEHKQIKRNQIT